MVSSDTIYILTGKFIIGILLFVRVLAFVMSGPIFRSNVIPVQLKVYFSVLFTLILTSAYWQDQPQIDVHLWFLILLVLKEFLLGLAIGFACNIIFWGARMAGGLIDFDMGYQTGALFNQEEDSPTLVGELKYMMALMIFLGINGHHTMLEALFASVRAVPLTQFQITSSTITMLTKFATIVFITGLKLSAPVIIAIFLTNVALALLARVAPQTNIFVLSFQLKIAIGLLVMFAAVPLVVMVMKNIMQDFNSEILKFILTLNPFRV